MFIIGTYQQKFSELILFLMIFAAPSLFLIPSVEPFEYIKMWFLINLILVFVVLNNKRLRINSFGKDKIFVLMFLILQTINLFFSSNISTTFFGNFYHFSNSYLYVFSLCIFYFVLEKKDLKKIKFLQVIVFSSIFGIFYGLLQNWGIEIIQWNVAIPANRIFSTFGQPNLYAQYLSSIFLVVLYLIFKKRKHKYFFLLPILLFILLNTGSLSVFISFFTTLAIVGISFLRKINLKLISSVLGLLLLIGTGVFFINYPRIMEQVRGGNSSGNSITNDTAKIRFILWSESLKQIDTKKFLIGSGEETFGTNFTKSEIFNQTSEWKQVFNKPHNIFLEYFFEVGIINLCFLLIVFFYALLRIRKNILYSIPFFIILSSSFLYTSIYSIFLIFLFFKLLSRGVTSQKNSSLMLFSLYNIKPAYAGKHSNLITKTVFWIGITTALLINNIFFISIINFEKNPCLSYKYLNFLPQYQVSCGILRKDLFIIAKGLENGRGDRILEEKVLIFYLQKNYLKEAEKIITNWEKKNKNDPIVIYYRGLYFEKIGLLDKAKIEFKKADELVPNFFAVKEKLNSLSRIKF